MKSRKASVLPAVRTTGLVRSAMCLILLSGVVPLIDADPAGAVALAAGTGPIAMVFSVRGSLPSFPCVTGCSTGFAGNAQVAGDIAAYWDGYDAVFTLPTASVTGSAAYNEPAGVTCPGVGSAAGTATLVSGSTSGNVWWEGAPGEVGWVDGLTANVNFSFERVGATVAMVVTSGTLQISFHFASGSGFVSRRLGLEGAGSAVFEADDPASVAQRCSSPGALDYTVSGAALVAAIGEG